MLLAKVDDMVIGQQAKHMAKIYTVQISKAKEKGLIGDPRFLDTTVKSRTKYFRPRGKW
jgi:hypothetical protein